MKILFYNHTGKVSGAERMLELTLAGLDRSRFKSIVLCPKDGPLVEMVRGFGVRTEICPELQLRFTLRLDLLIKYLVSFWTVLSKVRSTVVEVDPDVVHANSIRAGLVATAATLGLGTHVVWHLHDLLPRHPFSTAIRAFAVLFARTRMIAVSQAVADNFAGKFFSLRKRVSVILNGIELDRFKQVAGKRNAIRKELQLDETDFVIGIVGLLTPRKGQLALLRNFPRVLEQVPHAKCLIVGGAVFNKDEQYAELLRKTVAESGISDRVHFLGSRADVPAIMQSLDLLVMNSSVEPFGLVIVEAMACGTPVLAAISGGIPEIIQHSRTGWLIKQGNDRLLVDSIINLAESLETRQLIATRAREHALNTFSSSRYLRDLELFYQATAPVTQDQPEVLAQSEAAKLAF
ncbi:MAG TPA: glycosyltransferase family 4 protein [Pyrinomonadaceae bacterium]